MFYFFWGDLFTDREFRRYGHTDSSSICRLCLHSTDRRSRREPEGRATGKATYGEAGGRGPDTRAFDIEDGGFVDIAGPDQTEKDSVRMLPTIGLVVSVPLVYIR